MINDYLPLELIKELSFTFFIILKSIYYKFLLWDYSNGLCDYEVREGFIGFLSRSRLSKYGFLFFVDKGS